jgi:hypothetical protein
MVAINGNFMTDSLAGPARVGKWRDPEIHINTFRAGECGANGKICNNCYTCFDRYRAGAAYTP